MSAEVTRVHREAALRCIARVSVGEADNLHGRIEAWLSDSDGAPIDVSVGVWLGMVAESLAETECTTETMVRSEMVAVMTNALKYLEEGHLQSAKRELRRHLAKGGLQ